MHLGRELAARRVYSSTIHCSIYRFGEREREWRSPKKEEGRHIYRVQLILTVHAGQLINEVDDDKLRIVTILCSVFMGLEKKKRILPLEQTLERCSIVYRVVRGRSVTRESVAMNYNLFSLCTVRKYLPSSSAENNPDFFSASTAVLIISARPFSAAAKRTRNSSSWPCSLIVAGSSSPAIICRGVGEGGGWERSDGEQRGNVMACGVTKQQRTRTADSFVMHPLSFGRVRRMVHQSTI